MSNSKETPKQTTEHDTSQAVACVTKETVEAVCSEFNMNSDQFVQGTIERLDDSQPVLVEGFESLVDSAARDDQEVGKMCAMFTLTYNFVEVQTETEKSAALPIITEDAMPDIDDKDEATAKAFSENVFSRLMAEQPAMVANFQMNIDQLARDEQEKANLWAAVAVPYSLIASQIEVDSKG